MPTEPQDEAKLQQLFAEAPESPNTLGLPGGRSPSPVTPAHYVPSLQFSQWACEPNDTYRATCQTTEGLPPGAYSIHNDERGFSFQLMDITTDDLITLDDTASERVVQGIRKFWTSRASYLRYGLIYKRGILLWGPAGSGKTGTVMMLGQELVRMGGLFIPVFNPQMTGAALATLRRVEPDRPIILIFEDIDELIREHSEHAVLALLDGEYQIPNVVCIATTNYPEKLGPRIINRPSRFDERIFIDTPTPLARERYLQHITQQDPLSPATLACWVQDSAGFSIAHLRELVIAVHCLGQDYSGVVGRLKAMHRSVKPIPDYPAEQAGFVAARAGTAHSHNLAHTGRK